MQIQERDRCVKEIILILEFEGKVLVVVQARDLCESCLQRVFTAVFAIKVISIFLLLNQSWAKGASYAFDIEKSLNKASTF